MKNQPCTAHFAFSWMEIQKGPKRHPDRFRLKKSCLSSFKGLYKEKWTPPNMCHPPPMQRTQLLNNQCTTYFLCSFPRLLYIYIIFAITKTIIMIIMIIIINTYIVVSWNGVPLNHQFSEDFLLSKNPFWDPPFMEIPIYENPHRNR